MGTVLGISPGTRSIGIALLRNGKLADWKVQSFHGSWSDTKLQRITHFVSQYVDSNKVDTIAVKIPDELPLSANYIQLVGTLNVLFERKGIRPVYYTLSDLKRHNCPKEKVNKITLAKCIVAKYPDLLPEHHSEQSNRSNYYHKIFEAVAAAQCARQNEA